MKLPLKIKILYWAMQLLLLIAGALLVMTGCTTERNAVGYFAMHPEVFAKRCALQFPVKTQSTKETIPGPVLYVDCDSVYNSLNRLNPVDGVVNASGNKADRRAVVPVNCPPSTREVVEVENTAAIEAANDSLNQYKHLFYKQSAEVEAQSKRADKNARQRNRLIAIISFYVLIRLLKSYLSRYPVIGWLVRLIP